ncbi:MAG TPA: pilus assembly protein PilP [Syntrophales bacterium]
MRKRNNLLFLNLFLAGIFLVAGEGWSAGPADTKAAPAAATVPQAAYTFNPAGKPDPFKPFVEADLAFRKRLELGKNKKIPLSPLQRAGVENFKLLGIAGSQAKRTALVRDAAGKTYTLSLGTHIGLYNGKVVDIRSDRVVVEEPSLKKAKARKIEMKLRREGEEGRP